jgi:TP901 family phage tail tape measure protein
MAKVAAFKLKVEGKTSTLTDLEQLNKKLKEISDSIKAIKSISSSDALSGLIADQGKLTNAAKQTQKVIDEQAKSLKNLGNTAEVTKLKKEFESLSTKLSEARKEIENLRNAKLGNSLAPDIEKISINIGEVISRLRESKVSFAQFGAGISNNFEQDLAKIELRLQQINTQVKQAKSTGSTTQTSNLTSLISEQKTLLNLRKELNKELNQQTTIKINPFDSTSLVSLRAELSKVTKAYATLSEEARKSSEGIALYNKAVSLKTQVSGIEESLGDFRRNVGNYQSALLGLSTSLKEIGTASTKPLANFIGQQNIERANELRRSIDLLSSQFTKLSAEEKKTEVGIGILNRLQNEVKELNSITAASSKGFSKLNQTFLSIGDVITGGLIGGGIISTIQALSTGIKKIVEINSVISDLKADVRKTVGLTADEVNLFVKSLEELDTRTSLNDLLKIGAIGGQQGVEGLDNITKFTAAIDKLKVSLGDEIPNVDDLVSGVSGLSNVLFGFTKDGDQITANLLKIGNSLNVLSASGKATAPVIIDFASRIGGSLAPLGVLPEKILALSAAFQEFNILPERGATAINNLVKDLGANVELFAKKLQLNEDQLRTAFNTDPLDAFNLVLQRVTELAGDDKTKLLSLLDGLKQGGEGVSNVFLQLGKNQERFSELLGISSKSLTNITSLQNEYNIKNENAAAAVGKLSKAWNSLFSGEGAEKSVKNVANALTFLIEILKDFGETIAQIFNTDNFIEEGFKELVNGYYDLSNAIKKESTTIESSFQILKSETQNKELRKKAIDDLVNRYPELLNKYQLENASINELGAIQQRVTETMKANIREIIKARTQEVIATRIATETMKLARLETGNIEDLNLFQRGLVNLGESLGKSRTELLAKAKDDTKKTIQELNKEFANTDLVIDNLFKIDESKLNITLDELKSKLKGAVKQFQLSLADPSIQAETKKAIEKMLAELNGINLDADIPTQAFGQYAKKIETTLATLSKLTSGKATDTTINKVNEQSYKDASEAIKDYSDELAKLKAKTDELRSETISNIFDKEISELRAKFQTEIAELIKQRKEAEAALSKSTTPKQRSDLKAIIDESATQIAVLQSNLDTAIKDIESKRNTAVNEAVKTIEDTLRSVQELTAEAARVELQFDVENLTTQLKNELSSLELNFTIDQTALKTQLNAGLISQKEYNDKLKELDSKLIDDKINLNAKYFTEINKKYDELIDSQQTLSAISLEASRINLENERNIAIQKLKQLATEKGITAEILKQQIDATNKEFDLKDSELVRKENEILKKLYQDRIISLEQFKEATAKLESDQASDTNKKKSFIENLFGNEEDLESKLKELKDKLISFTQELSDTLFEIESNRLDREFELRNANLDKQEENELKVVGNNKAERERIEREFDEKRKKIEQEQAERRKKLAIQQAIINGALAITTIFAQVPKFDFGVSTFALAALSAATTLLQIAKIKSQSFAKGEYFNSDAKGGRTGGSAAPRDETGERPIGTGVLHEDEFISTARQTKRNRWLYDMLNRDRISLNHGGQSTIESDLRKRFMSENSATNFIPRVIVGGHHVSDKTEITLSQESIELISNEMSKRTSASIGSAAFNGIVTGATKAEKIAQREFRKSQRSAI